MVTCPNCGRRNSADNAYCANCGLRLPTAAARGAGIAYRRAEQAEPHGGGGQGLLAFGAVLLAGLLFAVGAVALVMSPTADASRTPLLVGAASPTSSLAVFEQETPSPSPSPPLTPPPSFQLFTPAPSVSITAPSFSPQSTPTPTEVATPRPTPTRRPTDTPPPTEPPTPTPVNCAAADRSDTRTVFLGYGNPQSTGEISRAWCIHRVIIRPYIEGADTPSNGWPGRTLLLESGDRVAAHTCSPTDCSDETFPFNPPHLTPAGSTLTYQFRCSDNPGTPEDECVEPIPGGATIEIQYETVRGT